MTLDSMSRITHVLDQIMVSRQRVTLHFTDGVLPSRILAIDLRARCFLLKQPWQGTPLALARPGTPFSLTAMYQGRLLQLTAQVVDGGAAGSPPALHASFPTSLQVCVSGVPASLP